MCFTLIVEAWLDTRVFLSVFLIKEEKRQRNNEDIDPYVKEVY